MITPELWLLQGLEIPGELKALYKTVWELRQRTLVEMAADRGAFIDQSQSFNVHMSDPNFGKLTSLHFHAWKVRIVILLCCSDGQCRRGLFHYACMLDAAGPQDGNVLSEDKGGC